MTDQTIKGLADLQKFLDQVPVKVETNIMRGALRAGMKPIAEVAKEKVAVASGLLRDGLKISTKREGGRVYALLRTTGKHSYLANWIEYGVAAHRIFAKNKRWMAFGGLFATGVQHPGIKPASFMRVALDTRNQEAVLAAAEYTKKRLATKHGLDTSEVIIEAEV